MERDVGGERFLIDSGDIDVKYFAKSIGNRLLQKHRVQENTTAMALVLEKA